MSIVLPFNTSRGVKPDYTTTFLSSVKTERDKMINGQTWTPKLPQHSLVTRYCYNSLNKVVIQKSPDGGVSKFYYDRLGRLAVSQNAKQAGGNQYSYTLYDVLGRMIEAGQLTSDTAITDATTKSESSLQSWFNNVTSSRTQITQTVYDAEYGPINGITLSQKNLRNRVSYTQVINNATDTYPASATYYTYDIHGNVDTLLQDFGNSSGIVNAMNQSGNRFKKMVYAYDLVSGKVNMVSYQADQWDAFYHRYSYDGENRLITVETSRDKIYWERDAQYSYYKHGPLAKTVVGQLQVQKQDYVYTMQGWLKAVNPDNSVSGVIAKNVYGFLLNYYNNDYTGIGAASPSEGIPSQLGSDNKQLFNGNISSMGMNIPKLGNSMLYNFQYDQLNRLVSMDAWTSINDAWAGLSKVNDYKERLSYDANGNILSYLRNGTGSSLNLNNYTYSYTAGTNKLASITNSVNSTTGTYSYDAIGNVTKDDKQNVSNAVWNVYGKLQSATKTGGTQINYTYGTDGSRILKVVADTTEAYVRDASGNIMSVYNKAGSNGVLKQSEINLYGSNLLGTMSALTVKTDSLVLSGSFGYAMQFTQTRGEKEYLLTDHRGNNMVSVTDRRQQYSAGGTTIDYYIADVKTASYYSAYGAISNSYNIDSIKYAFNGQRRSTEISATAQTALFWEYNADVGRRWNVDPRPIVSISPYAAFRNNPIAFIDHLGDTTIKGQRMEAMSGDAATHLKNVTVVGRRKGPNPFAGKSPEAYKPYSEVTSYLLDRNIANAEKLRALRTPARFPQGGTLPIDPDVMRKLDGALLKNVMAGAALRTLDKGFTLLDIVNIGMSSGQGGETPLEIPVIGGLTQMIVNDMAAETDQWLFENATNRGYLYFARFMNSSAGRRSGLTGVYATTDVMLSIIKEGGLAMTNHSVLKDAGYTDDSPTGPNMEKSYYQYFIFFKYENRNDKVIKSFGVLPITGQKWGE